MALHLLPEFINDLREHGDVGFSRRVLSKICDQRGDFVFDADDHRYEGIEDAWIRYVSRGHTAYRLIYIRRGPEVYLYRAGGHDIEDRLVTPTDFAHAAHVAPGVPVTEKAANAVGATETPAGPIILSNSKRPLLRHAIVGRRLIPHSEVIFVSPFISEELLRPTAEFGRLLDDMVEDGSKVLLLTCPPSEETFALFSDLEVRGVQLLFHPRVHAKVFIFIVDPTRLSGHEHPMDIAIVGSANLTAAGLRFSATQWNEEACVQLGNAYIESAMEFVTRLALESVDLTKIRMDLARRRS